MGACPYYTAAVENLAGTGSEHAPVTELLLH